MGGDTTYHKLCRLQNGELENIAPKVCNSPDIKWKGISPFSAFPSFLSLTFLNFGIGGDTTHHILQKVCNYGRISPPTPPFLSYSPPVAVMHCLNFISTGENNSPISEMVLILMENNTVMQKVGRAPVLAKKQNKKKILIKRWQF